MKCKKRIMVGLCVTALMSSLILTSCGQKSEKNKEVEDGKKTIHFWCHTNEPWIKAYEMLIEKFEKEHKEYDVILTDYPYSDYNQKIQTSLMSGSEGADVYQMWGGWELDFASTGALEPLPEDLKKQVQEDYFSPALGAYELDGEYYGIPMEFNLEYGGMVVNTKLFKENGKEYPTTWTDLRSLSDTFAKSENGTITMRGFDFIDEDALIYNYLSMILQLGGQYLNEDGSISLATPEGIKAMEELKNMYDAGYTDFSSFSAGVGTSSYVFEGKGSMASVGSWAISDGIESYDLTIGEDFDYVPVPKYGEKDGFVAESGWGLAVPQNSKEKEGAWEFVRFFNDPENLREVNIASSQLPPRKSLVQDETMIENMPHTKFLLDILEKGQWIGPYNTTSLKEALAESFRKICEDNADIKITLEECSETMSAAMIEKG